MICEWCNKEFTNPRSSTKFCSADCRAAFHYQHSIKVKNIRNRIQKSGFSYENIGGQIIQKPMEDHVYHPNNITKMEDRTNYYRGSGRFGYDDHEAIGIEDESSIE
jgi:hypothetical protein